MSSLTIGIAIALNMRQEPAFEMRDTEKAVIVKAFFKRFDFLGEPVIDPSIKGKASVKVEGAKFELMLQRVLTQVGATYRYVGGVWHIVLKKDK